MREFERFNTVCANAYVRPRMADYLLRLGQRLREAVQKHFGHASFREGQAEAVKTVLNGRDVVLVMPTGSGYNPTLTLIALALRAAAHLVDPESPERRIGTGPLSG